MSQQNDTALVSLIRGERYLRPWAAQVLPGWLHHCERTGTDLLVYLEALDDSPRARDRKFNWQKLLAFGQEEALAYRRLCWLDADILVNAPGSPSVFDGTPEEKVGAVLLGSSPTPLEYVGGPGVATIDQAMVMGSPAGALGALATPVPPPGARTIERARDGVAAHYAGLDFPFPVRDVFNTGVFTLSPRHHAAVFRDIYDRYEERFLPLSDNVPVPAELFHRGLLHPIDGRFNALVVAEIARAAPWLLFGARDSADHAFLALHGALAANHFLHFAGTPSLLAGFRPFAFTWSDFPRLGGSGLPLLPLDPFADDLGTLPGGDAAALRPLLQAEPALTGTPTGRLLHLSPRRLRKLVDEALPLTPGRNGFHAVETHADTGRPYAWMDGAAARLEAPPAAALGPEPRPLKFELELELVWDSSPLFLASFLSLSVLLNGHPHMERGLVGARANAWPTAPGVIRVAYRGYGWGSAKDLALRLVGRNWSPYTRHGGVDRRVLCLPIMGARLRLWGF